jgi:hypothetical protein
MEKTPQQQFEGNRTKILVIVAHKLSMNRVNVKSDPILPAFEHTP